MSTLQFAPLITTPWADASELPQIRSIIYRLGRNAPPAPDKRQQAVDLLEAWKMRGRLPHAMDSTCLLLNAILNAGRADLTTLSVRSVYAVAWTRFVTGFCDGGREATYVGRSMFRVAREIGMPIHFVELRHEIGHDGLPSQQRLAKAAEEGMEWLWSYFWADLDLPDDSTRSMTEFVTKGSTEQVELAVAHFRKHRKDEIRDANSTGTTDDNGKAATCCAKQLRDIINSDMAALNAIVMSLTKVSYLVPKKRQLGSSMDLAFFFWDPLLLQLSLAVLEFAPLLVKTLTQSLVRSTLPDPDLDPFGEALHEWLNHMLASPRWASVRVHCDESMRGQVLRACHGASGPVVEQLVDSVLALGRDGIFESTQRHVFSTMHHDAKPGRKRKQR